MPSDAAQIALWHDPGAWARTLAHRDRAELPFDAAKLDPSQAVMFDTTVYVDALGRSGLPAPIAALATGDLVVHAAVACAELAITLGNLDPAHPSTARNRSVLQDALARIPIEGTRAPSASAWIEAAVMAGILARTQGYPKNARRELLLDALLLLTASEAGCVLVSRDIRHMDPLTQLRPDARILLYDLG